MSRLSASFRLSLVLALLTVSIVILGDFLGVLPDPDRTALDARAKLVESLAVQYSLMAQRDAFEEIERSMEALVDHNEDVLSAALRTPDGTTVAKAGYPTQLSAESSAESPVSTATDVRVPIFRANQVWATVEIQFRRLHQGGPFAAISHPLLRLITFFAVAGFATYLLFLRRALRDLDPSAVIPERVKAAMDALAEGVLFLDQQERVVLANRSFSKKLGQSADALLGVEASQLPWTHADHGRGADNTMPWTGVLNDGQSRMAKVLSMTALEGKVLTFAVNCAPIVDPRGDVRGALVTFDDQTELQRKNSDLEDTLEMLQASQQQIKDQNKRLEFLATRDPLTSCLNRRAFMPRFHAAFEKSLSSGTRLSCIMLDIDHFKSVNDNYGHATGDQVISLLGHTLAEEVRNEDLVCRYGGEEFCVVLPDADAEHAKAICERIRQSLPHRAWEREILPKSAKLTASFGLTTTALEAATPEEMLDQADKALYAAKDRGRNRVISWVDPEARRAPSENAVLELDAARTANLANAEEVLAELAPPTSPELGRDVVADPPAGTVFKEQIAQAAEHASADGKLTAVLILELRMFRRTSKSLRKLTSDQILREVSGRLHRTLRSSDCLIQLEGRLEETPDIRYSFAEFGILLHGVESIDNTTSALKRLLDKLTERFEIEGEAITVTCNVGISVCPLDGDSPTILLDRARIALEHAKRNGAMGYRFYQDYMSATHAIELGLDEELRNALAENQFRLTYQPIARLQGGGIAALEALLRWEHPARGLVQPTQFIGLAERAGLMEPIERWVLREACTRAMSWCETGRPDICVNVNLSAAQFGNERFRSDIIAMLAETGLPPTSLQLELNEADLVKNIDAAIDSVHSLRRQGVRIGVDDLGVRSVSLDYLEHLRPDSVKVHRTLVHSLSDGQAAGDKLQTLVDLAHSLEITVAAVGVETEEQLDLLQNFGFDFVQGYFLCPPVTPDRARELLNKDRGLLATLPSATAELRPISAAC